MTHGTRPFRYWIADDAVLTVPPSVVPPPDSPLWEVRYDNDLERGKRTLRDVGAVSPVLAGALAALRSRESVRHWSAALGYPVGDDPTLWGAGLHASAPGAFLQVHLDFCRHPVATGMRRALNLIAFAHQRWEPGWGGELLLCDPSGKAVVAVEPKPGRLVAFESDGAMHGVRQTSPDAGERVSLAVYFLAPASPHDTRTRAMYLPNRSPAGLPPAEVARQVSRG